MSSSIPERECDLYEVLLKYIIFDLENARAS